MRVVVRTPAEIESEFTFPDLDEDADDEQVLAAAGTAKPLRKPQVVATGEPYVYARVITTQLDALAESGARLIAAEARLERERRNAQVLARRFFDEGMAKSAIAATLGITRPTLDAWLAKSEPRRRR